MKNPIRSAFAVAQKRLSVIFFFALSLSTTASLHAQNCTINAGIDQTICANGAMTLTGAKSGSFQTGVTTWSQVGGSAVTITSPNALTTGVTGFAAGTYTFRLSTTCLDGSAIYDDVVITVSAITLSNAGPDQTLCPGSGNLAANSASPGTGYWGIIGVNNAGISVSNSTSPTSAFTLPTTVAGSSTLRWTITQGACTSFDDIIITNRGGVSPVDAGPDQTLSGCYTSTTSATLAASFAGNGSGGQGGLWSVVSGPNAPVITTPASNTSTVTNLIQGTYVLRWTASGSCLNGYDDVQIIVPAPSATLTASNPGTSQTFCDGRSTVVLTGNNPTYAGETVLWTQTAGPAGATISSPGAAVTTVTGLNGSGTYTFQYSITNTTSGCSSVGTTTVAYNTAPSISANGGADYIYLSCGTTMVNVPYTFSGGNATQCRVIAAPAGYALPGYWTDITAGTSPQPFYGISLPGTYTIRFMRTGGTGCQAAYDDVNVIVSKTPSQSRAGTYQTLACNVFSTSLAGNIPAVGTGSWSQVSGPNTASIANPALNTSGISGLVNGKYIFKWIVSAGPSCPASEDTVSVVVASTTPTAAAAGPDRTVCNGSPVVLAGNTPALNETGVWTVSPSTGITFSNASSPTATVNGLQANTVYTFTWTIANACGSTRDDVLITASSTAGPVQATAGADQCLASGTTSTTLSGNAASPVGTAGLWSQLSGPNTANIAAPAGTTSSVTGMVNGTYQFVRTMSLSGCANTTDTVVVTVSGAATAANSGADQSLCASTATLAGNLPSVGTGAWSQVGGPGGVTIASPLQYNSALSGLQPGVYTFRWTISNGGCASNYDDVALNVSVSPSASAAGPDQTCLTTTSATLAATSPTVGTGLWSQVSGPAPATITATGTTNTSVTGLSNGVYTFRWTVTAGAACTPSTDDVIISVNQAATSGGNISLCNTSTTSLTGNANATGAWTQQSGPNTALLTTLSGSMASVENLQTGAYVFRYTLTPAPGCAASYADKTVTITAPPSTAIAGANQSLCNASTFSLGATAPTVGTGAWSKAAGPAGGSFSNTAVPGASFSGAANGLYTFQWTVTNGGCSNAAQVTVNNAAPSSAADAGPDQSFCGASTTNLAAAAPASGTGTWTQLSGPNAASILYPASATSPVSGVSAGTYWFRWTVTSGACAPTNDDVKILVCGVLPLRLLKFNAEKKNAAVQLSWKTADEQGFTGFVLERSVDGIAFQPLTTIAAKGGASNDYGYADNANGLMTAALYYRLKMLHANGDVTYSEVKVVRFDKATGLSVEVLPNPVKEKIVVRISSSKSGLASVTIVDHSGETVLAESRQIGAGKTVLTLNEKGRLANGVYVVTVQTVEAIGTGKVLIER